MAGIVIDGVFTARMKTHTFTVVVEPDEGGFHAYCPAMRHLGAVTQGATESQALRNISEVIQMIIDELREDGKAPSGSLAGR